MNEKVDNDTPKKQDTGIGKSPLSRKAFI